jgi:hypothetical protein
VFPTKEYERTRSEVLIETFIRKRLHLKAHTVTKVEETDECMLVHIDRLATENHLETTRPCGQFNLGISILGSRARVSIHRPPSF